MERMFKPEVNKCRHFKGAMRECCEAGVVFSEVSRVAEEGRSGHFLRLPCVHPTEAKYPCSCLSRYTDAEVKAQEEEMDRFIDEFVPKMELAQAAIMENVGASRKRSDVAGVLTCPVCLTGNLKYTYCGSYNGHVHAGCSTPDCVRWGE